MHSKLQLQDLLSRAMARGAAAALGLAIVFALTIVAAQAAPAQTFKVLYNFTGGADGGYLQSGLTMDEAGNLYGTTYSGGSRDAGTVFKLSNSGSGWIFTQLYSFLGGEDGAQPFAKPIFGADGSLYGTTTSGGGSGCWPYGDCGTVFKLTPPAHVLPNVWGGWTETVLYRFSGSDGSDPYGDVVFDQAGNLDGTTHFGGVDGYCGLVYELTPSGDIWVESILHSFVYQDGEGCQPTAGLTFDQAGNLYGVASLVVFQLTPAGNTWKLNVLAQNYPFGGLIFDQFGSLYGTEVQSDGGGTVFMLSPSGDSWTYTVLYDLPGNGYSYGPVDRLARDTAGTLYGTTYQQGAYGYGSIFKLAPSGGGWVYTDLHDFTGGSDGLWPFGLTVDRSGNLYGTATGGGAYGGGVVWEITP